MSLEDLLKKGVIERVDKNSKLVEDTLKLAERDIKAARSNFREGNYDWVLAISYNAMLQAGRALMFSEGFRPVGEYKHVSVVAFTEETFGVDLRNSVLILDKLRRRRHKIVYEVSDTVSESEASNTLKVAEEFIRTIKKKIKH